MRPSKGGLHGITGSSYNLPTLPAAIGEEGLFIPAEELFREFGSIFVYQRIRVDGASG
jgi:hypothetical protein